MSNKTSDKDVANIEELIQEYKTYNDLDGIQDLSIYVNALEHILAEREQMIAEKKKYTIRLTDEQYRKVIENAQMDTSNDTVVAHRFAVMQQQINEKDKRIQELEKELENNIPKQVIKDKIEELKTKRRGLGFKKYLRREDMLNEDRTIFCEIQVLQELLEGEK